MSVDEGAVVRDDLSAGRFRHRAVVREPVRERHIAADERQVRCRRRGQITECVRTGQRQRTVVHDRRRRGHARPGRLGQALRVRQTRRRQVDRDELQIRRPVRAECHRRGERRCRTGQSGRRYVERPAVEVERTVRHPKLARSRDRARCRR